MNQLITQGLVINLIILSHVHDCDVVIIMEMYFVTGMEIRYTVRPL